MVLGLVVVLAGYIVERDRIIPPRGVQNLESFARVMPAPQKFAEVEYGGGPRFVWVGNKVPWAFRSGPPCYIFDSSGKLCDWDWETGAGQNTSAMARIALKAKSITIEEALAYITKPIAGD